MLSGRCRLTPSLSSLRFHNLIRFLGIPIIDSLLTAVLCPVPVGNGRVALRDSPLV